VLPFVWAAMVLAVVAGFVMIVAYWLDIQDRTDLKPRAKIGWSTGIIVFPISIPLYAFFGGGNWPPLLRAASFIPAAALTLFALFVLGVLG
jgi:Na+/pantothenate symporter